MIGTAHQRSRFDVRKAELDGKAFVFVELFLRHVAVNRQVFR